MRKRFRQWCWSAFAWMRLPLPASTYHYAALHAAQRHEYWLADRLFEQAARCYRSQLQVERLANARIHQLYVRLAGRGLPAVPLTDCALPADRITRLRGVDGGGAAPEEAGPGATRRDAA